MFWTNTTFLLVLAAVIFVIMACVIAYLFASRRALVAEYVHRKTANAFPNERVLRERGKILAWNEYEPKKGKEPVLIITVSRGLKLSISYDQKKLSFKRAVNDFYGYNIIENVIANARNIMDAR